MTFADDLDTMAELGWGPGHIDRMILMGLKDGDLAQFRLLSGPVRLLVFRIIDDPGADWNDGLDWYC